MPLVIDSPAFTDGGPIPIEYTCQGEDLSPALDWHGIPDGTQSLVLIVDDPDAPDPQAPSMTWVHWVLYNLPADSTGLAQGVLSSALPSGTGEGINDWLRTGYGGPCPPVGRHRYFYKLYALDMQLRTMDKPTKTSVEAAMRGHVIEQATLVGTYEKSR